MGPLKPNPLAIAALHEMQDAAKLGLRAQIAKDLLCSLMSMPLKDDDGAEVDPRVEMDQAVDLAVTFTDKLLERLQRKPGETKEGRPY